MTREMTKLNQYMARTKELRKGNDLLVSYVKPHQAVGSQQFQDGCVQPYGRQVSMFLSKATQLEQLQCQRQLIRVFHWK